VPEAIVLIYSNKREDIYCVFTWTIAVITGLMTVSQEFKVSMETRAKLHIQEMIRNGRLELIDS